MPTHWTDYHLKTLSVRHIKTNAFQAVFYLFSDILQEFSCLRL